VDRRLEIVDRIHDPLEVGDVYALASWIRACMGLYREGAEYAARGFELTRGQMPSAAVHCQSWKAVCRFRLGEWEGFLADFATLLEMLGDRRTYPPYFASRPFGAAAFVHIVQGDDAAADRILGVIDALRVEKGVRMETARAMGAVAHARRGDLGKAREYVSEVARGLSPEIEPALWEAECELVADEHRWEAVPGILAGARAAAERGGLLALPAFADRLEGRWHAAEGRTEQATQLLERARDRFDQVEARWELACTDLDLASALIAMGRAARARGLLESAVNVFEELSARRELAAARELMSRMA
jgi:tetratricopeptide (TPR) repeat protein